MRPGDKGLILEEEPLRFVHSKLGGETRLRPGEALSGVRASRIFVKPKLLETKPTRASLRAESAERFVCWLAMVSASNRHAAAGASQRNDNEATSRALAVGYSRRLIFAEGRRGCQERNWFSSWLISFSFIIFSFKANF